MVALMAGLTRSDGTVNLAGFSVTLIIAGLLAVAVNLLYQAFSQVYVTIMYLDARRREGVPAQAAAGYPYAGGPAYQQTPSSAGAPPATGAHYVGLVAVAGGVDLLSQRTDEHRVNSPAPPAYPTSTAPGEPPSAGGSGVGPHPHRRTPRGPIRHCRAPHPPSRCRPSTRAHPSTPGQRAGRRILLQFGLTPAITTGCGSGPAAGTR